MLSVTYKPFVLSVVMLSVVMLNVIMLSVIMLSVVSPLKMQSFATIPTTCFYLLGQPSFSRIVRPIK
jgi:hypothetical protein